MMSRRKTNPCRSRAATGERGYIYSQAASLFNPSDSARAATPSRNAPEVLGELAGQRATSGRVAWTPRERNRASADENRGAGLHQFVGIAIEPAKHLFDMLLADGLKDHARGNVQSFGELQSALDIECADHR